MAVRAISQSHAAPTETRRTKRRRRRRVEGRRRTLPKLPQAHRGLNRQRRRTQRQARRITQATNKVATRKTVVRVATSICMRRIGR
jgi:hypothetical protein